MPPRCALTGSLPASLTTAFRNLTLTSRRQFSSKKQVIKTNKPAEQRLPIPPYPYGQKHFFKQADKGLYGGSIIQSGNKISKGKNKGKTRRTWKPNIRVEELWSAALQKKLKIKVQHRVLRTIKKVGGLDQYLLGDKPARIKELGVYGWKLRWRVMMSEAMKRRFEEERKRLKLPRPETFEEFLQKYTAQQQVQAVLDDQAAAAQAREDSKQAAEPAQPTSTQPAPAPQANLA